MGSKTNHQGTLLRLALLINMLSVGTLMMIMPLGPDLVRDIGLAGEQVGLISGGATLGSALIGFLLAPYLDKFDRKKSLVFFLVSRSVFILLCSWSESPVQLIVVFVIAGCFSGPLNGLVMASVIDATRVEERGRAMAFVASGFSLAAILVVPVSLLIAQYSSWQMAFILSGVLGLVLAGILQLCFPKLSQPQQNTTQASGSLSQPSQGLKAMVLSLPFALSIAMTSIAIFGHFLLVPNISTYFQFNLSFPREEISYLYFFGGIASILAMRWSGKLLDRGFLISTFSSLTLLVIAVVYTGFVYQPNSVLIYVIFILFMASSSARSAMVSAVVSRCPPPQFRAAFMSYQSTASNVAAGLASVVSSLYLSTASNHQLQGIDELAGLTILCSLVIPVIAICFLISLQNQRARMQQKQP
ncbi:MFS transporter [Photobacterium rosenbergii]|uniref:MFS transporter n=1 Tax=Photobacterium rosenbergii TaxID=294936 RepID=A0ABU3ZMK6_9GAMM|nr:MFS transporter [Photobacterium rosenbergii]MDV5171347.1 MFS transporter [Photobacterium rosenbergii]